MPPKRRTADQLREDALAIWWAGVDAVRSDRLIKENVRVEGDQLIVVDETFRLNAIRRIVVVGAGKAGAGMAAGLVEVLGEKLLQEKNVTGWINVPADCAEPLPCITLHAARPAGVNEPTVEGVFGGEKILDLVESLESSDLCICLLSGGGSALLPAPVPGISLKEKQIVTQFLSAAGANIEQLNRVRKQLSRIKGGGLARACRAGQMISLIISDVPGDSLETIASGPTVPDSTSPSNALSVLHQFTENRSQIPASIWNHLESADRAEEEAQAASAESTRCASHFIIGNNAVAVDAAGVEAERRGYSHAMTSSRRPEPTAEGVGRHLADMAISMRQQSGPDCLISGGEPVVKLAPAEIRGKGGRNQQLALAALCCWREGESGDGIALLSGGTDGEDGPTDAAGTIVDAATLSAIDEKGLDPDDHLHRNDAYSLFAATKSLLITGPTHTNVCDIRVLVVDRVESH